MGDHRDLERQPLLSSQEVQRKSPEKYLHYHSKILFKGGNGGLDLPQGPVEGSVIGPDELPPPYEKTGGIPMVACRVCQVAFAVKYQVFKVTLSRP